MAFVKNEIRHAIENDGFVPYFHPLVDLRSGTRVAHNGWQAIFPFKSQNFSVDVTLLGRLLSEIH